MMLYLKTYKWVVVFSGREEEAVAIAGRDGGAIGWVSERASKQGYVCWWLYLRWVEKMIAVTPMVVKMVEGADLGILG